MRTASFSSQRYWKPEGERAIPSNFPEENNFQLGVLHLDELDEEGTDMFRGAVSKKLTSHETFPRNHWGMCAPPEQSISQERGRQEGDSAFL